MAIILPFNADTMRDKRLKEEYREYIEGKGRPAAYWKHICPLEMGRGKLMLRGFQYPSGARAHDHQLGPYKTYEEMEND